MPITNQTVGPASTLLMGTQGSGTTPVMIVNQDSSNTIYVADQSNVTYGGTVGLPLGPGSSISLMSATGLYACSNGPQVPVAIIPQGSNYFLPPSLSNLGGVKVYIQASMPVGTANLPIGSLWLETNASNVVTGWYYWTGTAWVQQTFNASEVLTAGTIVANLIAAGTIVAGIVNGTTITGAQIVADGTQGELLVYNGTPAASNLLFSQSARAFTDAYGNNVPASAGTWYSTTSPGAAYSIDAASGESWSIYNSDGNTSQQGTWTVKARWWQDAEQFYVSNPITPQQPGAAPDTPETWHSLGTLSGTGAANWTVNQGRYKLTADGTHAEIDIVLTASAATTAGTAITFSVTLPAGYQPLNSRSYPMGFNGTVTTATDTATLRVGSSGTVEMELPALPASTIVTVTQIIPVD